MKNKQKTNVFNMIVVTVFFVIIVITVHKSSETASEKSETFLLEKFRILSELITLHKETRSPAPAPAPLFGLVLTPPVNFHRRHRPPRPRPLLPLHKFSVHHKQNDKQQKNFILAVILPTVMVLLLLALGVFFTCRRFKRQKKVSNKTTPLCSNESGKSVRSKSAKKVSHDSSIDMFYLNAITSVLEPELLCLRPSVGKVSRASPARNNLEREVVENGLREITLAEILSIPEYPESSKNDPDDQRFSTVDKVFDSDTHFSEIESYHSFSNSRSSSTSKILPKSSPRNSDPILGSIEVTETGVCSSPSALEVREGLSTIPPPVPPPCPPTLTPNGKDDNPLPKLKPLHWDKVRATSSRSMVWDKLSCSSFELDEETIESLFGYSLMTMFTNPERKSKIPSPSKHKHVLEPKRLQNITILSKALNVTSEEVCEALVQGDGLCTQQLEVLVKMEPTKDEQIKLSNYNGEIDELGSAEKLVKEMLKIPYAFKRVEAMLYKFNYEDEVVHLRNSFSMLEEACKELRSNRLFLKLLEAVLKTGNRMNVGTTRGGAKAFKLDALLKLADVKGTDGKTTLLHFVVQEISRSEGLDLVSGLSTELHNVKRTASLNVDVLATSVSNLLDGTLKLKQLLNTDLIAAKDSFVNVMQTFISKAEYDLQELQTTENSVLLSVRQITEYYHGNVSRDEANPLRIFVVVRDFLGMLDQVCKELKTLKNPRSPNPINFLK
ncbi:hypothetical protein RND81_12G147500 [Saponaria officinalis]|uniref:Formin-like protein n=1 Tax=Saponaria officinalis TaxID=3572 RepID=A0AAW1HAQ2_SAPOF